MQDELGQNAVTGVVSVAAPEDGEEGVSIHFEACFCSTTSVVMAAQPSFCDLVRQPLACVANAAVTCGASADSGPYLQQCSIM